MSLENDEINDPLGEFLWAMKEDLKISAEMIAYAKPALKEHEEVILLLLSEWYAMAELFFRDYLSGEFSEISWEDLDAFQEAMMDPRYDLIPCIVFWKPQENPTGLAETSAIWVEFHRRGDVS